MVPHYKKLTIQNAPGAQVWLDGSERLTQWTASGSSWYTSWDHEFDSRVSYTAGADQSSRMIDPEYPMAGHPEQVWVNGEPLTQVGSRSALEAGTFFVDTSADRLYVGTRPTSATVHASTLAKALQIQGEGTTVRGIGVRRYANHLALIGAVSAEVEGITLENMVITQNATVGLGTWNPNQTFRSLTVSENGMLGISVSDAPDLSISDSLVRANNLEHFKPAPVSGGIKVTSSQGVVVSDSLVTENVHAGLWFDEHATDMEVTGSTFRGNTGTGLQVELGADALLAGNYVVDNGGAGLKIIDSSDVRVWNNTIAENGRETVSLVEDGRHGTSSPWHLSDLELRNNVLGLSASATCPILFDDQTDSVSHTSRALDVDHNLLHRSSATAPERLTCLPYGSSALKSTRTFAALQDIGWESHGALLEGSAALDGQYHLTSAAQNEANGVAVALPASLAAALEVSTTWRGVGAPGTAD